MFPLLRCWPFTTNPIGAGENDRVGAGGDGGSGDHAKPGRAGSFETICGGPGEAPRTTCPPGEAADAVIGPVMRGEIGRVRERPRWSPDASMASGAFGMAELGLPARGLWRIGGTTAGSLVLLPPVIVGMAWSLGTRD